MALSDTTLPRRTHGNCSNPTCNRVLYIPPAPSGLCVICDFDRAVAEGDNERQRHTAAMAAQEFSNEWAEAALPPPPPLWERPMMFTPTDGSGDDEDIDFPAIEREMWGPFEDDTPEVGELFDDIAPGYDD